MSFNDYLSLSLPFLGALTGIMLAKIFSLNKTIGLKLILSFSGAFLLGITVFELLPEIFIIIFIVKVLDFIIDINN